MKLQDVVQNIVNDTAVHLTQEFDRNFERKAFFDRKWPSEKIPNHRGSLLMRSGKLRRSVNHRVGEGSIRWASSLPYASIHNEGGELEVTAKMKSYFWAMYYNAAGAVTKRKDGKLSQSTRNQKLTAEAQKWKALALQKVGAKMTIEERRFIGWHPQVDQAIATVADINMQEYDYELQKQLKQ